jgi:hypothetical protein
MLSIGDICPKKFFPDNEDYHQAAASFPEVEYLERV